MQPFSHFNFSPPTIMHLDLNSCFATIEQQANPNLRGKPVAVAAYVQSNGCILAASREAKAIGIQTGMRVREGKMLCPQLLVLAPDPEKYRFINHQLSTLLSEYSAHLSVESIDEMVLNFWHTPKIAMANDQWPMTNIAKEIKQRIRNEIGEWLTVSIGIAPNRYLAKVASDLHKPDGLDLIDQSNIEAVLGTLALEDLCGIKEGYGARLRAAGISTPLDFYRASPVVLKRAFRSAYGYAWWLRLHGYDGDARFPQFGSPEPEQKSFGQSYALGKPYPPQEPRLHQILAQLVAKMGRRLRADGYIARGIHSSCLFVDHTFWHHGEKQAGVLFADGDIYRVIKDLLLRAPAKPVRILAVGCFCLTKALYCQESLLDEEKRKVALTQALDAIHDRWGEFMVTSGRMLGMEHKVLDRIAFGGVK